MITNMKKSKHASRKSHGHDITMNGKNSNTTHKNNNNSHKTQDELSTEEMDGGSDEDDNEDDEEVNNNANAAVAAKEEYLRALAAEGLRVGREMSRRSIMKSFSGKRRAERGDISVHSNSSPAVETLLRVFPMKRKFEIDSVLHKTSGDILKSIELLLGGGGGDPKQGESRSKISPERERITQAMEMALDPHKFLENAFQNSAMAAHQLHQASLKHSSNNNHGSSRSLSPVGPQEMAASAFSLFGPYSAAAGRFNPNHPGSRNRFLPSLLPYTLPGLHPPDFYANAPFPLVSAAAAMSSAALRFGPPSGIPHPHGISGPSSSSPPGTGTQQDMASPLHVGIGSGGSNGNNCNNNSSTGERENGTPPTSCSGSDRASYSE